MKKGVTIAIVTLVLLAVVITGILVFTNQSPSQSNNQQTLVNNPSPVGNTQNQTNSQNTSSSSPATHNIAISGFAFSPSSLAIKAGDTVTWTNQDSVAHTIVSDSGSELSSSAIQQSGTYSHTFTAAGTFSYHCSIHPSMAGQIIVQ